MVYTRTIEMPIMRYVIPGTPTPLQRPRYGMGHRPYDAQKMQKHEFRHYLEAQHGNLPFYTTPLRMFAYFFFMVPKVSAHKGEEMVHCPHTGRPDVSNLIKYVEDCAEGILYRDDAIIYYAFGLKLWSYEPRTEFIIVPDEPIMKVFPDDNYQRYSVPLQK